MENLDTKVIEPILREHDVEYAGVFGSRARGDNRPDSDLDLLVRFRKPVGYFTIIGLEDQLSETLGQKVDLVTEGALSPHIKDRVMTDLETVYESCY